MFHVLMFQVRQSDQVTGHCTDYLLSLYTRSVMIGTMVIIDTNQVVRLSTGGGRSGHQLFFVNYYPYSLVTLWCQKSNAHDTNTFIEAWCTYCTALSTGWTDAVGEGM